MERFDQMLAGGHHNSLGRTQEVVAAVLREPAHIGELFACYESEDELVRLRTSSALRKAQASAPELLVPLFDRFIAETGALDQASAQWTLAILFDVGRAQMSAAQREAAEHIVRRNLAEHEDWIVLNNSMMVLARWSKQDADLRQWLKPHLARLSRDPRKSVARRARKLAGELEALRSD